MKSVFVIDTNVVVAGLITGNAESPVARVLDGMLGCVFNFAVSEPLLAEYRRVLLRSPIHARHGLSEDEVDSLLISIVEHAVVLHPGSGARAPDPGDQFLWDLLAMRNDLLLVTGDQRLLADAAMHGRVLGPLQFAEQHLRR